MATEINKIFEMLNGNSSEKMQRKGIEEGKKVKYLSIFIQPIESKAVWENCAKIIASKSDKELYKYLCSLLEWLKDANWPGFDIIYHRLEKIPADLLDISYSISINEAIELKDEIWLENLSMLSKNYELYNRLIKRDKEIIDKYIKVDKRESEKNIDKLNKAEKRAYWKLGDVYAYKLKSDKAKESGVYGQYIILRKVDVSKNKKEDAIVYCQISKNGIPKTKKEIEELDYVTIYIKEGIRYSCRFEILNLTEKEIRQNMIYIGNYNDILEPDGKNMELTKQKISVDFNNFEIPMINCITVMK